MAKEQFPKQKYLTREEYADQIKQLYKAYYNKLNRQQGSSVEHPEDLLDAKINVAAKFHPESPNQFTFQDLELLIKLQKVFHKGCIKDYYKSLEDK